MRFDLTSAERVRWVLLDSRAVGYLENQLSLDSRFCRHLRKSIDLSRGQCSTLLPQWSAADRAYRFDEGDLLEVNRARRVPAQGGLVPVATLRERQAGRIAAFLGSDPKALCLVDDVGARRSDPAGIKAIYATGFDEEVVYWLDHQSSAADIRSALAHGNQLWHGLVVLCLPERFIGRDELADPLLARCFQGVLEVQSVAYDGEGFVTWTVDGGGAGVC